ncbi:hypothetical protein CRE_11335 [Caenorhabditis remanei]|uniref:Uncharacterized protein n=1 Tax=Caenorhabditis remanei TaxID=31234 RepID=E3N0E4_CAERE|nr:hypothetical protein CRE_11335 [Caenorhabditis remanei]
MNQYTFFVNVHGEHVNYTINNITNIIVTPNTFAPPPFRQPQENPPIYNNHQNERTSRSSGNEPNDYGDAPSTTANATTVPEGHPYDENEVPPPRANLSNQQDIIGMRFPRKIGRPPITNVIIPSNNSSSVGTLAEVSGMEGRDSEQAREPDEPARTAQTLEAETSVSDTQTADTVSTDAERSVAETAVADTAVAAEAAEIQTSADETTDILLIDAAAGIANTQTAAAETSDTQLIDFQIDDIQLTDVEMVNAEMDEDLDVVAVGLERDRHFGAINAVQTLKNNDVVVAEGSGSKLLATRSVPVTPSIPRQNRKRRAETDDGLCPPTPRRNTTASRFLLIQYHPSLLRSSMSPLPIRKMYQFLKQKPKNSTVSNVMTETMPVGQNRDIQHFRVQNRSEKKDEQRVQQVRVEGAVGIIKDTATPFFVRNIRFEVPLRFIIYTTKYPTKESYNKVLGNSQCKNHVKSSLADESFFNEIEKYLNEKGKKDFHDIIRTTIDHFERDTATAVGLGNRFLQSK